MNYETIELNESDGVVILRMNRPEVMNALNTQMRGELAHAVTLAPKMGRALVITGNGGAFCSGQDLGDGVNAAEPDLERTLRDEYFPLMRAMIGLDIPVVAAVNGAAAGAGANLALLSDVVIAAESAYFLQAFSRIGLIPDAGGTWLLPRQVGIAKAMGATLFAERISAKEACQMGMIWEAVPDDEFASRWLSRARHLADGPTQAYAKIKQALRSSYGNGFEEQIAFEAKLQGEAGRTRDFKEGLLAFVEKRKPEFEGR